MYQDIDIIVSTTLPTIDRLSGYKNGWDALLLYFRYVRQARLQKTNTTYSKDTFMAQWMSWSMNKFYKVKKVLTENNLVETVIRNWADGKIEGKYIKVNFIIKEKKEEEASPTILSKNHTMEKPSDGKMNTNAWSNKINAWSNKYKYNDTLYTKKESIAFIYTSYAKKIPSDKKKYNLASQAKLYIEQLLKEYDMSQLMTSIKNYYRKTDSTYIMATQYFFSNSKAPNAKKYRVFEEYLWKEKEEGEKKIFIDANIF